MAVLGAALLAALPAAAARDQVAVLPLLAYGVPSDRVEALEGVLAAAIQRAGGGAVLPLEETRLLLDAAETAANCSRDQVDCLVLLGNLMSVGQLVSGSVQRTDAGYEVVIRVVDVTTGREDRRISGSLRRERDEAARDLEALAFRLYEDPTARLGGLIVAVHEAGAEIFVDDQLRGKSPLEGPIYGLSAGVHRVRVRLPGRAETERQVQVAPAAVVEIQLRVIPDAPEVVTVTEGVAEEEVSSTSLTLLGVGAALIAVGVFPLLGGVTLAGSTFVVGIAAVGQAILPVVPAACEAITQGQGCAPDDIHGARELYQAMVPWNWVGLGLGLAGVLLTGAGLGSGIAGGSLLALLDEPPGKKAEEGEPAAPAEGASSSTSRRPAGLAERVGLVVRSAVPAQR